MRSTDRKYPIKNYEFPIKDDTVQYNANTVRYDAIRCDTVGRLHYGAARYSFISRHLKVRFQKGTYMNMAAYRGQTDKNKDG